MYPDSPGSPDSRDCRRLLHGTTADDPFLTILSGQFPPPALSEVPTNPLLLREHDHIPKRHATDVLMQIQITQFHIDKIIARIPNFTDLLNCSDVVMGWWTTYFDYCIGLFLDYISMDCRKQQ